MDDQQTWPMVAVSAISAGTYAIICWAFMRGRERKRAREIYGTSERIFICKKTIATGVAGGAAMLAIVRWYSLNPDSVLWITGGIVSFALVSSILSWKWG